MKPYTTSKAAINTLKLVNRIRSLDRRLRRQSQRFGLAYEASAFIVEACIGGPRVENGETFVYPSTLELKIEGRSNWFYSVRIVDGALIPEGRALSDPGRTLADVYRSVVRELKEHAAAIKLQNEADAMNGVVFRGAIIPVVGCKADDWFSVFKGGRETVFAIVTPSGRSRWFGCSAREALNNAAPFLKETPLSIELEQGGQS